MIGRSSGTVVPRRAVQLERAEAMDLLGSVSYGRVVFTLAALPAIRPVNHVIDDGEIVIRTRRLAAVSTALTTALTAAGTGLDAEPDLVVAYEADLLDPESHLGWSVVVTGIATPVTDPARLARIDDRLRPWIDSEMDTAIAIAPEIVTGLRLVAG
jgi:hypothetical protein